MGRGKWLNEEGYQQTTNCDKGTIYLIHNLEMLESNSSTNFTTPSAAPYDDW